MLREKFAQIIQENILTGYSRGIDIFLENLEVDLQKREVISENGIETIVESLMENANID